jgi:formiminotetrahydrofolate cyclodeaminase
VPFTDLSINAFLEALASPEPVPGGGSSAALGGALGAALVSMVCRLTIGRKGYESSEGALRATLQEAEGARARLTGLIEEDTQAYRAVMAAHRLPRATAEQRKVRDATLEVALAAATDSPLRIAECCARVVALALPAAELGNTWAVSDAAAGALLAEASMRASLLNVEINLASMRDAATVERLRRRASQIPAGVHALAERVLAATRLRMHP